MDGDRKSTQRVLYWPFPVGAQWTAKPSDTELARRVIRFLEDRRILYNACAHEEPQHCVQSALDIRKFLTDELTAIPDGHDLLFPLRTIRAACRKFLDQIEVAGQSRIHLHHGWERDRFQLSLGEFRGAIGPQVALLAGRYEIDVEDELAKTLPVVDD